MNNPGDRGTCGSRAEAAGGFDHDVPNLYRMLARSEVALTAFVRLEDILERHGLLSRDERAVVALEVAMSHRCNYCRGVMSHEAREAGVSHATVDAILHGFELRDLRHRHLVDVTRRLMTESGCLGQAEVTLFEEKGVPFDELLEIIAIIAAFTLATYANNLARTRIDPEYR
jgi:AhpD family alkylhydroperoxidase